MGSNTAVGREMGIGRCSPLSLRILSAKKDVSFTRAGANLLFPFGRP